MSEEFNVLVPFSRCTVAIEPEIMHHFPKRGTRLNFAACVRQAVRFCRDHWSMVDQVQCLFLTHENANVVREELEENLLADLRAANVPMIFLVFGIQNRRPHIRVENGLKLLVDAVPGTCVYFLKVLESWDFVEILN